VDAEGQGWVVKIRSSVIAYGVGGVWWDGCCIEKAMARPKGPH
jgi:hypothetical protein